MNQLCSLTNFTSSDIAAWAQAIVSSIAIIVGAFVVFLQTRRARLEQTEREARVLDGIAYFLIHLKESAHEARAEKKKLVRLPQGHPAEPSARFKELTESIHRFPLEVAQGAVPIEALLVTRRVSNELLPLVGPEPELDVNPDHEDWFHEYVKILDKQILSLQDEAKRLMKGKRERHAAVQN